MKNLRRLGILSSAAVVLAVLPPTSFAAASLTVTGAQYNLIDYRSTSLTWNASPGATGYAVYVNGLQAPVKISTGAQIDVLLGRLLGPADVVEVAAIDGSGVVGSKTRAEYWRGDYVHYIPLTLSFAQGSDRLSADAVAELRKFGTLVKRHGFTQVVAVGHDAGSTPSPAGYALGKARARTALKALAKFVNVEGTVSSWGNAAPLASNRSAVGRAENRRVEFNLR